MKNIEKYLLSPRHTLLDALKVFDESAKLGMPAGIAVLVDETKRVMATITEGDIRRAILDGASLSTSITQAAQNNPICFHESLSFREILELLPKELEKRGRRSKKYLGKILLIDDEGRLVRLFDYHQLWEQKVASHRHVVVIGLGYVGLTLAVALADAGFMVTGVENNGNKVKILARGDSYIKETGLNEVLREQINRNLYVHTGLPEEGDVFIISVGTPVEKNGSAQPQPVLHYIHQVCKDVGQHLRPGNLVILRSTVPVGTSRQTVLPLLEQHSGLKCGRDFHLAFAPERTAEGKALKELRELPQVIGGVNEESMEAAAALFRDLTPAIIRVGSLEAAEMVKLVNNSFRDLIFSFSNQVSQIAAAFNIDVIEVIKAANQGYPRDPVPLPSPGVGGPCLTKDPYIFDHVAEKLALGGTLFEQGRAVNESMHAFIENRIITQLEQLGKPAESAKILICGLAFKGRPETGDIRNSSAVEIHRLLKQHTPHIKGHDPIAETKDLEEEGIEPAALYDDFNGIDAVLFLNNHRFYEKIDLFKMTRMMARHPVILDSWGLFHAEDILKARPCIYMGLSVTRSSI